jgi:hypothetical protein
LGVVIWRSPRNVEVVDHMGCDQRR